MTRDPNLTVRDIMTPDAECASSHDTLQQVARRLRDLDVGSLPVCGDEDKLIGIVTDRDIVVSCIASGGDPARTEAGEIVKGKLVVVDAASAVRTALRVMADHQVRRLPVLADGRLVGIVSQADVARHLPEEHVGELVEAISQK